MIKLLLLLRQLLQSSKLRVDMRLRDILHSLLLPLRPMRGHKNWCSIFSLSGAFHPCKLHLRLLVVSPSVYRAISGHCFHISHLREECIKEIFSSWLLSVMSTKDIKLALIVIEKYKFSHGSLKNAKYQFLDRFFVMTFTNVNWFMVTKAYFNGRRNTFKKAVSQAKIHRDLIKISSKIVLHNLLFWEFWIFNSHCFPHHVTNVHKAFFCQAWIFAYNTLF